MKKRLFGMLLALCLALGLLPTAALAEERPTFRFDPAFVQMNVGETVKMSYEATGGTPVFTSRKPEVATISASGLVTALKKGQVEIEVRINDVYVGIGIIHVADPAQETNKPTPIDKSVWPFVPSEEHKTDGKIKSDWYILFTHDLGTFSISDKGDVRPSRRARDPFYFEHLGKEVYYIRDAQGNYLGYNGKPGNEVQVTVRKTPCKWKIEYFYDWQYQYMLLPYENTDYAIYTYGLCSETEDSMVRLGEAWPNNGMYKKGYYTLQGSLQKEYIPQWYQDLLNGESKPTTDPKELDRFGKVPTSLAHTGQDEWDVLRCTNIERAKAGLPLFVTFDKLQEATGIRGDELVEKYDHTRPNGSNPFSVLAPYGISYTTAAENISMGASSAKSAVEGWMNSPGHKKNIMTEGLRYMGTGYSAESGVGYWVQLFATTNGSECKNIVYNEKGGYFKLYLQNGIIAYAPYDEESSPEVNGQKTFKYPGVSTIGVDEPKASTAVQDGWYNLRSMNNYYNLTKTGYVELRNLPINEAYYVENKGDGQITLKLADGRYVGLASSIKNGVQLKTWAEPYLWCSYAESGTDVFSLRPAADKKMLVNATSQKSADGTKIIVWSHEDYDAPNHGEIRFVPTFAPAAPVAPAVPEAPAPVAAVPSATKLTVNGKAVVVDAYNINQNNYIKLRDLAAMLKDTNVFFEVSWDGEKNAINLLPYQPYTPVGGELKPGDGQSKTATLSTSKICNEGNEIALTAYLIGQNNYFKLRDVMRELDVYVGWDQASGTASIDTQEAYKES